MKMKIAFICACLLYNAAVGGTDNDTSNQEKAVHYAFKLYRTKRYNNREINRLQKELELLRVKIGDENSIINSMREFIPNNHNDLFTSSIGFYNDIDKNCQKLSKKLNKHVEDAKKLEENIRYYENNNETVTKQIKKFKNTKIGKVIYNKKKLNDMYNHLIKKEENIEYNSKKLLEAVHKELLKNYELRSNKEELTNKELVDKLDKEFTIINENKQDEIVIEAKDILDSNNNVNENIIDISDKDDTSKNDSQHSRTWLHLLTFGYLGSAN